jgi:hypothetical protein
MNANAFHAGIEKLKLELSIGDRSRLSNQLIQTLLAELTEQPERIACRERYRFDLRLDVRERSVGLVRTDPDERAKPTTRNAARTRLAE